MQKISLICIVFTSILVIKIRPATAWDNDEFEIFDLVEEVNTINKNFYEYLEIPNDASTSDVRKAYRRLSLVLHPDKNQADDAELKFRWLAAIYETLKDPKKREIYDRVLVEGLPDWRMPAYYFRRMRKVGLAEGLAYLLVLTTVVQYAVNWAAYWERKFTMRESVSTHLNKRSTQKKVKRAGKDVDADKIEDELENQLENMGFTKPTILGLLPFQIMRGTKDACFGIPKLPSRIYSSIQEHKRIKEEEENRIKEEEEEFERKDNEKKERKEQQRQRKLAQKQYAEKEGMIHKTNKTRTQTAEEVRKLPRNAQQLWTDEDLAKLAKLIKKFPGGTTDRWETIAEMMERLPWEVTKMAGTIKGTCYQVPSQRLSRQNNKGVPGLDSAPSLLDEDDSEIEENSEEESDESESDTSDSDEGYGYTVATKEEYEPPIETKKKAKTKGGKQGLMEDNETTNDPEDSSSDVKTTLASDWSQVQQKEFEQAIKGFPKGTDERWDRIASKVGGKSKEECLVRFKYLAAMVKNKKETRE